MIFAILHERIHPQSGYISFIHSLDEDKSGVVARHYNILSNWFIVFLSLIPSCILCQPSNFIVGNPGEPWSFQISGGGPCVFPPCELLANGGFEDNSEGCNQENDHLFYSLNMECWSEAYATADIMGDEDAGCDLYISDQIIAPLFGSTYTMTGAHWGLWEEAIQQSPALDLEVENTYLLTFWYYQPNAGGFHAYHPDAALDVYVGSGMFNNDLLGSPDENGLMTIATLSTPAPAEWTPAVLTFTEVSGDVLIIRTNCSAIPLNMSAGSYFGYDEFSLKVIPSGSPSLNLPECTTHPLTNLEQYASLPGGVFTIAPDDGSLEIIDNGDGTFNYNLIPEGNNSYIITYTIENGTDCPLIAAQAINTGPMCVEGTTIQTNTVWTGVNATYCGNIVVEVGVSLTIESDSEIRFADGCGIILKEGADLYIAESMITADLVCNPFWNGISAQRSSDYLNTVDKNTIIINNSTISFAETGLNILTLSTTSPNTYTSWADITISNSAMVNNKRDMNLIGQAPGNQYPIILHTYSSYYVTDLLFPENDLPSSSKCLIKYLSKPVVFQDCWFDNTTTDIFTESELTAIDLTNSGIYFTASNDNVDGINSQARFSGFTRGIKSVGFGSQTTWIQGADFACWRGVYLRNVGSSRTIDCDFYCLQQSILNYLDEVLFWIVRRHRMVNT
jgi:hypothetical protein